MLTGDHWMPPEQLGPWIGVFGSDQLAKPVMLYV